jgi:hypothetical protein
MLRHVDKCILNLSSLVSMAIAYLLTGANLGDRKKQLEIAASLIQDCAGPITATSAF